jgi:hypothetical protein
MPRLVSSLSLVVASLFSGAAAAAPGAGDDTGDAAKEAPRKTAPDGAQPPAVFGAYYYPWYSGRPAGRGPADRGWLSQALRARLVPRQMPALGVYDSRDPAVIAAHIRDSERAGIGIWAVSWWGPGTETDVAFRDHILKHPNASKLKYAALYESTGRLRSGRAPNHENLVPDFEYLARTYFDDPRYLRIDGKPVVFIYLTRVYFRGQGGEALKELRARVPGVYLVGDDVFGGGYEARHAAQWDAITAYDVYGQSLQGAGATQAAIDRLRKNFEDAGTRAREAGRAFIPAISPGFNDRAVRDGHAGRARYFSDRPDSAEGDIFRAMLRQVAFPLADARAGRIVMITSFNEWYEDTQIEATAGGGAPTAKDDSESGLHYTGGDRYVDYGTLYLDILREEIEAARKRGRPGR